MNRKRIKEINACIGFARDIISDKENYLILDTETTGLGTNDVVIQIGIIDLHGNVLLNELIKPTKRKRIGSGATAVHGITIKMLENASTFKETYPKFIELVGSKKLLIYNAEYDIRLIKQTAFQDGVNLKKMNTNCIMKAYSVFVGEWSEFHDDYKFQKLYGGDHSAIGDCLATLKVIEKMASAEKIELPKQWWEFWKSE